MISNPLKNFPWIVLNITPGALCHTRWISRQNHTVHYRVLNRTLNSDWMVPNKVQVRCDREAVYKSTVNFWFEKSSRDIEDFGKDCKFRKITLISIMLFINISISLWFLEQDSASVEVLMERRCCEGDSEEWLAGRGPKILALKPKPNCKPMSPREYKSGWN